MSTNNAVTMTATYFHRHPGEVLRTLRGGHGIEVVDSRYGSRIVLVRPDKEI